MNNSPWLKRRPLNWFFGENFKCQGKQCYKFHIPVTIFKMAQCINLRFLLAFFKIIYIYFNDLSQDCLRNIPFWFFFRLIGQRHKVFHTFCTCLTLPFPDDTVKIPWPSFLKFQRHELVTYWFRGQNAQRHVTVYCKTWTLPFFSAFINTNFFKGSHINFEVKRSNITGNVLCRRR